MTSVAEVCQYSNIHMVYSLHLEILDGLIVLKHAKTYCKTTYAVFVCKYNYDLDN